ncbi:MAG: hypothetical protein A2W19_16005 [Spirochaetes bacterium RBG_16_49_21]|nr:MAG: hypothetical protein A2W19_16005 [Spirochaetes bacterium RBG_16_49_21]
MSYWDYRVIRKTQNDAVSYEIHEVYYNDKDEIESWTEEPVSPMGETCNELRNDIFYFMSAFRHPVLNMVQEDKKERLEECEDEQTVNPGHYFEVMDRASVVLAHFDEFIVSHPVVRKNDHLKESAQKIIEALYGFYNEAAGLCCKKDAEGKSQ